MEHDGASADPTGPRGPLLRGADWLLRDRETGRWTVAQLPNASIALWGAATLARRLLDPTGAARTALVVVATVALAWWSLDELLRGVNPFRRILGAVVLAGVAAGTVARLTA